MDCIIIHFVILQNEQEGGHCEGYQKHQVPMDVEFEDQLSPHENEDDAIVDNKHHPIGSHERVFQGREGEGEKGDEDLVKNGVQSILVFAT